MLHVPALATSLELTRSSGPSTAQLAAERESSGWIPYWYEFNIIVMIK
jgi:hypothetical protein